MSDRNPKWKHLYEVKKVSMNEQAEGFIPTFVALSKQELEDAVSAVADADEHDVPIRALFAHGSQIDRITFKTQPFGYTLFESEEMENAFHQELLKGEQDESQVTVCLDALPADARITEERVKVTETITMWHDGTVTLEVEHKSGLTGIIELA